MRAEAERTLSVITKEISRVSYPFDHFQLRRNTHKKVATTKNASKAGVATIAFVEDQMIGEYNNNEDCRLTATRGLVSQVSRNVFMEGLMTSSIALYQTKHRI